MTRLGDTVRARVGHLLGKASGQVSSAVLLREAARTSRRWQTYAGRLGFSGMLIGGLLLAVWVGVESPFADPSQLGWLGRGLFIGIATLQFGMALMLAPLACASAMVEERDQGTMDLLILSRLRPEQIASAKVLSRVLLMLTVVFGAMPVMAAAASLGGVSGAEVVSVTLHTATAVVLAGAMGALFAQFTDSPLLAMIAAAGYAVPAFVVVPAAYAILSFDVAAATHLSLLGGPLATGFDALLAPAAHLPVLYLVWRIGTRLFDLRTRRAHIREAFSTTLWYTGPAGWLFVGMLAATLLVLPFLAMPLWALRAAKTSVALTVPLQGALFLWGVGLTLLIGWVYIRIGADVVDAMDRTFGRGKKGERPPVHVWSNPIAWREARPRAWGSSAVPIQFTWLVGVLLLSQSTIWIIPGGLIGLGMFNLIAAIVLTIWLATWSIESERRLGSLEVLLTTTLPSWKLALGKAAGIALPTAPLVVISLPMLVFGNLYANLVFESTGHAGVWIGRGVAAWLWSVGVWGLALGLGLAIALSQARRSAFALSLGSLAVLLGIPAAAGRLFPHVWWIAEPSRLIAPPLAGFPSWWQLALSTLAMWVGALVLFALCTANLRRWVVAAAAALLGLSVLSTPALAQPDPISRLEFAAHPVADGFSREGRWTAIQVSIANHGKATTGSILLEERPVGTETLIPYRRQVELPEQSRKDVLLLVQPGIAGRVRTVTLDAGPTRKAAADIQWQAVEPEGVLVGVIGDEPLGLTAIGQAWKGPVPARRPSSPAEEIRPVRAGLLNPRLLPRHSAAYDALDQIVWHRADPSAIGTRELDALLNWVAAGGHLAITVTDTWRQVADSPLGEALPVDLVGTRDVQDLSVLIEALGLSGASEGPAPQALAVPRREADRGAWILASDESGYAQWSIGTFGLGTITVLAVDPTTEPLASRSRIDLWRGLLWLPSPDTTVNRWRYTLDSAQVVGGAPDQPPSLLAALRVWEPSGYACYYNDGWEQYNQFDLDEAANGWRHQLRTRLNDIPGASPIPLAWLLGFSVLYLFVIGPVDYFVLRWLKREPWTWVTFPVTVIVFSGVALIGTAYTKGSQAVITRVEVVDILPGTDRWRGSTALGVFSTRKTRLTLSSAVPDGVIGLFGDGGTMWEPELLTREGPGQIRYRAETWTLAYAKSDWVSPERGRFRLTERDGIPVLENLTGHDLTEVVLIEGDPSGREDVARIVELGRMEAGESAGVGESADWALGQPRGEIRWAWRLLREHPDAIGAHLHGGSHHYTVLALSESSVDDLALDGLAPIYEDLTVFRAPLGPPVAPGRPAWSDDLP